MKINHTQKENIKKLFKDMNSKTDFLNLLNHTKTIVYGDKAFLFSEKQLNYYINIEKVRKQRKKETYNSFEIKKKSGKTRTIHSPVKGLKEFQSCLNTILTSIYIPHESAYGFVEGKSIVDNAKNHVHKNYVYNIDLKDFFPSVDSKRVWGRLQVHPFNLGKSKERKQIANMIKAICCTPMSVERQIDNKWSNVILSVLPQGAPTSPILTNAICERLDIRLTGLSKRFGLNYSRYADDITFSSMHNIYCKENGVKEYIYAKDSSFDKELRRIVRSQNFHINESKVRLQKQGYKQEVTGLIVNEKVNIPRRYIKELRQWIYFWESKGYNIAYDLFLKSYVKGKGVINNPKPNMQLVIDGKLLYLKMVKGEENPIYLKLKERFDKLVKKQEIVNELVNTTVSVAYKAPDESSKNDIQTILDLIFKEGLNKAMENYNK